MTRFWVTLRQFAFVLTACLAACNGAGKTTPAVSPSAAATSSASASTPSPDPASTSSPTAASTSSATPVPLLPSASTTLGLPLSNGISGILVLTAGPALPAGVTVSIVSASTGAPAPQSVRRVQSASALATWHIAFAGSAASIALTSPPSFTVIGATNQSALIAELFDVTATGAPILFNHSTNGSFTATGAVTLNLSHTYYLELVSGSAATPASPTPTPSPPATAFAGGATIVASFPANVPASAHSASFSFSGTTGSPQVVAIPAGCSPACTVTVSAPPGSSTVQVLLYASANAFGTPLAHGTTSVVESQNQSTAVSVGLIGIIASLAISLNPATVTIGQATPISINYIAVDAAGDHLAPGSFTSTAGGDRTTPVPDFDAPTLTAPAIAIAVDDPTGAVSTNNTAIGGTGLAYSGFGAGPATVTVHVETCSSVTSGTCSNPIIIASASATLTYAHSLSAVTSLR